MSFLTLGFSQGEGDEFAEESSWKVDVSTCLSQPQSGMRPLTHQIGGLLFPLRANGKGRSGPLRERTGRSCPS